MRHKLSLLLVGFLTMLGLVVAVPSASAAPASSSYVGNSTFQGTRSTAKTIYNVSTGAADSRSECYKVNYGYNALAAFMELVRTGDFTSDMVAYLGHEDSELVSVGIHLNDRLTGGTLTSRQPVFRDSILNCPADSTYMLGSLASSGATLGGGTYPYVAPGDEHSLGRDMYNINDGVKKHYYSCYEVIYGGLAMAAALQTLKSGDFTGDANAYIGEEDSEITGMIFWARNKLLGERPSRGQIWTDGWPTCQPGE